MIAHEHIKAHVFLIARIIVFLNVPIGRFQPRFELYNFCYDG
jgi:hypothetical protein